MVVCSSSSGRRNLCTLDMALPTFTLAFRVSSLGRVAQCAAKLESNVAQSFATVRYLALSSDSPVLIILLSARCRDELGSWINWNILPLMNESLNPANLQAFFQSLQWM